MAISSLSSGDTALMEEQMLMLSTTYKMLKLQDSSLISTCSHAEESQPPLKSTKWSLLSLPTFMEWSGSTLRPTPVPVADGEQTTTATAPSLPKSSTESSPMERSQLSMLLNTCGKPSWEAAKTAPAWHPSSSGTPTTTAAHLSLTSSGSEDGLSQQSSSSKEIPRCAAQEWIKTITLDLDMMIQSLCQKSKMECYLSICQADRQKYLFCRLLIIPTMKVALLAILLVAPALSTLGVDVSQHFTTSTYQCIKNAGYHFISIRGYCSYGAVDPNIVSNLNNARAAGFSPDIYMFPCRGKSVTAQVDQMIAGISGNLYGKVWIDVETNPSPGCGWGSDHSGNCNFVTEIVNRIKHHGKGVGIYASKYMWQTIMGSATACAGVGSEELWYAHYDGSPSFSDFTAFGGWKKPSVKQFQGDVTLCGAGVDKNYKA